MNIRSLDYIRSLVEKYSAYINAPTTFQPTYGFSQDGARPHIEVNNKGYHYVVVERGKELKRITTNDIDELLYNVFKGITFQISTEFELENRVEHQDSRRIFFKKQEELLGYIKESWKTRKEQEHNAILRFRPFRDK
jgi:Immunity protein 63